MIDFITRQLSDPWLWLGVLCLVGWAVYLLLRGKW